MHALLAAVLVAVLAGVNVHTFTNTETGEVVHAEPIAVVTWQGKRAFMVRDAAGKTRHLETAKWRMEKATPSAAQPSPTEVKAAPQIPRKDFEGATAHEVLRVIDGDTVVLLLDDKQTTVRLIGVDTPETVHPTKPVEVYGKEASAFLG